jgi:parallel beta helix pectate lyase-like protein
MPRKLGAQLGVLSSLVTLVAASPAMAANFVDRDSAACSDSRSAAEASSASTPWCSLARAAAAAPAGGEVLVREGTFPSATLSSPRSGFVTFRPYGSETVTVGGLSFSGATHVRFVGMRLTGGLTVSGSSHHVDMIGGALRAVSLQAGADSVLLEGNTLTNPSGTGINFSSDSSRPAISNVTIRGNRIDGIAVDAIQAKNFRNLTVAGNEFANVRRPSGSTAHPDVLQTVFGGENLIFRDNYVHDYDAQGFFIADGAVKGVVVENNLIEDSEGPMSPVRIADAIDVSFVNNTVRGLTRFSGGSRNVTIKNNLIQTLQRDASNGLTVAYQNHNLVESGPRTGPNDIGGTPRFVNPSEGNFDLAAGSPGIDAGTSSGAPATDRLGRGRFDDPSAPNGGSYHDLGAHERNGTAGGTPTPTPDPEPQPDPEPEPTPAPTGDLKVSRLADRSSSTGLAGETHFGTVYVFATTSTGVSQVSFWIDDPQRSGPPKTVENLAPWDLFGGGNTAANPLDTTTLPDGQHTITALLTSAGGSAVVSETFTVENETAPPPPPPVPASPYDLKVSTSANRSGAIELGGATVRGNAYVFVPSVAGIRQVRFHVDEQPDTTPYITEKSAPWDLAGGTAGAAKAYDTRRLANGRHTITGVVQTSSGTETVTATFNVAN